MSCRTTKNVRVLAARRAASAAQRDPRPGDRSKPTRGAGRCGAGSDPERHGVRRDGHPPAARQRMQHRSNMQEPLSAEALSTPESPGPSACHHCGAPLGLRSPSIVVSGREVRVCGEACRTAAESIVNAGLDAWYGLRTHADARGATTADPRHRAELDAWRVPEVEASLLRRGGDDGDGHAETGGEPGDRTVTLTVEGMRCAGCAWLVERLLASVPRGSRRLRRLPPAPRLGAVRHPHHPPLHPARNPRQGGIPRGPVHRARRGSGHRVGAPRPHPGARHLRAVRDAGDAAQHRALRERPLRRHGRPVSSSSSGGSR